MASEAVLQQTHEIEEKTSDALSRARALVVDSPTAFEAADGFCVGLKSLEDAILGLFREPRKKAAEAFNAAKAASGALAAAEAKCLDPVSEARKLAKSKMGRWLAEEEAARQKRQDEAEAKAKKRQEDEALDLAQEAEAEGNGAKAAAIINTEIVAPKVALETTAPKAQTVIRKIKKYRIVNAAAIQRAYLVPDEVAIGKIVRAQGKEAEAIVGGIEVYEDFA